MMQHALIVGAGNGLSGSLARRLSQEGVSVSLAARNTAKLAPLCEETGASAFSCDASEEPSVASLFKMLEGQDRVPDFVVYNAGYYARGAIEGLSPEDVRASLDTNALGAFLVAREAARRMVPAGRGVIAFTGATAGMKGFANSSPFAMGKFALRGLCQSLARELAPKGIHIIHFILDGVIFNPERGHPYDDPDASLHPDKLAEAYLTAACQHRSTWSWEIELRPFSESF